MDFQSKVAIVTGGAQGIGRAVSLALARDGAAVVIADVDGLAARALAEGIGLWGGRAMAVVADVSSEADAARIAAETVSALGGVDILVNCASSEVPGTVESTPLDAWAAMLSVNLTGVYLMSRFVLPEMRRHGGGVIVNVAAIHGLLAEPGWSAYAAGKGGVIALSRGMALDYAAEGIRVNCVCPGSVEHPLRPVARQPLGRPGTPEEVADMVLFLAGPRASFITGGVYTVDGGLSAGF
ncbi:SDR family oxidoreductase [Oscillochloris sp. ZM17-4]|uniref:SDR family NAD(P)-dependent oxidoreductase n=1 Tax=Oscillochloris sp. ZM17-4 TaxID=2866714 RepID=UPI001C7349AE|nr:SDR family oxidoreductase [Oscillochloris sp. ZM17-4]MBX0328765.1 SDR family oxidoreductase [Oscillochloris sp. ZM17-4]